MNRMLIATSLLCLSGAAQADFPGQFKACAAMVNGAERLACYDGLARSQTLDGTGSTAGAEPGMATETTDAREQRFGAERMATKPEAIAHEYAPDSISSRVRGEVMGWDYKTRFELDNGQIWEVAEQGHVSHHVSNPAVTIEKGVFGVYYLSMDGINKKPKVKRVK